MRKKNVVQVRPLTAEIKNNNKIRATASSGMRKIFRVVIYIRKQWCKVKCMKSERMGRK